MNSRRQILSSDLKTLQALCLEMHAKLQQHADALEEKNAEINLKNTALEEKNTALEEKKLSFI
jgi:hypothetical protein